MTVIETETVFVISCSVIVADQKSVELLQNGVSTQIAHLLLVQGTLLPYCC